jgi:hypothetical protein
VSLESWSTAAAVGTFVVITVTAVAALIQLAHLRRSNQLQAVIDLGNAFGAYAKQISFVFTMLPEKMKDPDFRRDVGRVISADEHPELLVCAFCDQLGMLVRWHLMEEQFIMGYAGGADRIVRCWDNLEDVIAIRRRLTPGAYVNFEYLASRARKWISKFPQGNYPAGEPRMPLTDRWATDEANL